MKTQSAFRIFFCLVALIYFFFPIERVAAQGEAYYRFSPTAIYDDGSDSTTLEIYTGGNVASVTIKPEFAEEPVYQLLDDGTNGDRAAGDGVYTLGRITTAMYPESLITPIIYNADESDADISTVWLSAQIQLASGQTEVISFIDLRIVSSEIVFPAEQVGNGLYATEYAFFIIDPGGETYSGSFPNVTDYNGPAIAKKFYSVYPDEFDFLNFDVVRGDLGMKAHAGILQPTAKNIGVDDRGDYSSEYGSQGRLLTMVYSGTHGGLLNHELGHTWGAFVGTAAGISNGVHWAANTDINGIMSEGYETADGLYFFTPNDDGTFNAGYSQDQFAPLELYLMGMIPPEEVSDVHALINPDLSNLERVTAQRVDTYTIEDIIAMTGGPRDPAYPDAQTHFNLSFILLSDSDFSPAEFSWFTYYSRCYMLHGPCAEANFYTATGGRGTVNTRLDDWGTPNIQSSTTNLYLTQPQQPTHTAVPIAVEPTQQVVEVAPEPTPVPRPVFNFPICSGAMISPAQFGIGWLLRSLFL